MPQCIRKDRSLIRNGFPLHIAAHGHTEIFFDGSLRASRYLNRHFCALCHNFICLVPVDFCHSLMLGKDLISRQV